MSLKGKRIVVTGASKGLGLGVVKRLCEEGANIIAHYNSGDISEAKAAAEAAGVEFAAFQADMSNLDDGVGDQTADEYFVSKDRANEGVRIVNNRQVEPMVILQHFGPDNAVYVD